MRETQILAKLSGWDTGGPNGPLSKWVDALLDGEDAQASPGDFTDKVALQKTMLHAFFKVISEHDHSSKEDLLRAAYALLIFPQLKIPFVDDVERLREIAQMLSPKVRHFVAHEKLSEFLEGHHAFIWGLSIDANAAKKQGASREFWVYAFYSMSVSVPLALISREHQSQQQKCMVITSEEGQQAQSALMIGQVLRDIASFLNAKPSVSHEDMGCELGWLTALFDENCDERLLDKIGFYKAPWPSSWGDASRGARDEITTQLRAMGIRIATMVPHYWLFSRGYSLPRETVIALHAYRNNLLSGPSTWDSFRNTGRWMLGMPLRDIGVLKQEYQLIDGILRCDRMGFLNLRVLQQFSNNLSDAIKYGDSKTGLLHKQAQMAVRRELYKKAQHLPGPGIQIPSNDVLKKIRQALASKTAQIPSPIRGSGGPTRHMLIYGVSEQDKDKHVHSKECGRAQKAEVYRFIDEQNNLAALTLKGLLDLLTQMCCFEWKLGCQKSPIASALPAQASLFKDEVIYWVVVQLCTIAGGYGEDKAAALRETTRLAQRDGVMRYIRDKKTEATLNIEQLQLLIDTMSWYTWEDFCAEQFVTWMPSSGCDKLIEQVKNQQTRQAEFIREYIVEQMIAGTLSLAGLHEKIDSSSWYTPDMLQKEEAISTVSGFAGNTLTEQVFAQIQLQLEPLYTYIKEQKNAGTLSLIELEKQVENLGWCSWHEFKKLPAVDWLDKDDAQTFWEQVGRILKQQEGKSSPKKWFR